MPKERRKYKEYLWNDQLSVPKSTKYLKKKETTNSNINANNNRISEMPIDNQELNYDERIPNDQVHIEIQNESQSNDFIHHNEVETTNDIEEEVVDDEEQIDNNRYERDRFNQEESVFQDIFESLISKDITKNDLAIAYLTAFFNSQSTQDSLSDFIKLSNFTSDIKLPCTFDGLSNLVIGKDNTLKHEKAWFCNICIKSIKKTDDRLQRSCYTCKSR
jgi:hypothetical protein